MTTFTTEDRIAFEKTNLLTDFEKLKIVLAWKKAVGQREKDLIGLCDLVENAIKEKHGL